MSELCLSRETKTTTTTHQFSILLLSHFFYFCSFVLSHPLYFSYFVFFSPYLLKLLSFLSPLFVTTSLLLLALLTVSPSLHDNDAPQFPFLLSAYCNALLDTLRSRAAAEEENTEFRDFEDLEAYGIVFNTSIFDAREMPLQVSELKPEEIDCPQDFDHQAPKPPTMEEDSSPEDADRPAIDEEKKALEDFLGELDKFDRIVTSSVGAKKVGGQLGSQPNKVDESKEDSSVRRESEASGNKLSGNGVSGKVKVAAANWERVLSFDNGEAHNSSGGMSSSRGHCVNLGSYGSMRKEKEWKRTLACKLFEERHNVEGSEGMDLLWETYEMDSSKAETKDNPKKMDKKKGQKEYHETCDFEEEEEEDEEEDMAAQMCCLQALKFSTGKMNLGMGMGRPNLLKISKAIKGIGWLHRATSHGRKRYN